jgi:ribosomal protein L18E
VADSYRQGNMQVEKQLWRRILNKLYKGEEERLQIEVRVIEAIKQVNCR